LLCIAFPAFLGYIILLPDQRLSALAHINWKNNVLPEDMGFGGANTYGASAQNPRFFYSVLIEGHVVPRRRLYQGEHFQRGGGKEE
jgi:hypothetical protein